MDYKYTCETILKTLKTMNFADVQEQGFLLLYKRENITDNLHKVCGFRTDYKFITKSQMKKIRKKVKVENKILYFTTDNETDAAHIFRALQRFFDFEPVKDGIIILQ